MDLVITTWNTQGNPANSQSKREVLDDLLKLSDVLLIQECGALDATDVPGKNFYLAAHAGALNSRCNTCMISNQPLSGVVTQTLAGGTGRSALYGIYNSTLIVGTMHAISAPAAPHDATTLMQNLLSKNPGQAIIIGGDFNADPSQMSTGRTRSKTVGSGSRGIDVQIASPGCVTQKSGRTLDYFIHTTNIISKNTGRYRTNGGSDHYPVATSISSRYS